MLKEKIFFLIMEKRNFDKDAAAWDEPPRRIKMAEDIVNAIRQAIPLNAKMSALDFGCGTGLVSLRLLPFVGSVTGVDSSQGMIDVFKSKIENQNLKNARAIRLDIDDGDVLEGCFDLIMSSMTIHHIQDIASLFAQFYDATAPEGYIAIADLDSDGGLFHTNKIGVFHNGFNRAELSRMMENAGFANIRDFTAVKTNKIGADGKEGVFSIFLLTGQKCAHLGKQ
ncbi:MAG: hypothetical protein BWY12_00558 [candidate division BRC1 bacterium ADurb.Bin183]|nr:MAG: hypothetical protein BWY12_00558 [candidate division BRC1 bacterium ADurb.Bin183]